MFDSKLPASFIRSSVVTCRVSCDLLLPEYVTLDARKLADYLLALFHQSKRFYAENVKAKATANKNV